MIFYDIAIISFKVTNIVEYIKFAYKFCILDHLLSHHFDILKCKSNRKILIFVLFAQNIHFLVIWNQSHSPHLNGHSPHVASVEWVG